MTVTDEPGYYEDGNFGIRLENVLIVKEADTKFNFGDNRATYLSSTKFISNEDDRLYPSRS
jgi:Xaa-Pro aminopeptidase